MARDARRSRRAAADHLDADGLPAGFAGARLPGAGGSRTLPTGTRCSASWCWPGSPSRSASSTARECRRRRKPRRPPSGPSRAGCAPMRRRRAGGGRSPPRARRTPGWTRPAWCSMTCPRCISRPTPGTGSCRAGCPRERRLELEPQITIGLLTDQAGFPLMVSAFEGNKAKPCSRSSNPSWPPTSCPMSLS